MFNSQSTTDKITTKATFPISLFYIRAEFQRIALLVVIMTMKSLPHIMVILIINGASLAKNGKSNRISLRLFK